MPALAPDMGAPPLLDPGGATGVVGQADNWVQCDRCSQWRRVPESVVDNLADDSHWYCEDNPDPKHNSCSVPQELTNAEIDRGRMQETLEFERAKRIKRPAIWQLIRCAAASHASYHADSSGRPVWQHAAGARDRRIVVRCTVDAL